MRYDEVKEGVLMGDGRGSDLQHCCEVNEADCSCGGDGRIRRRLRNRQAILAALGALVQNGVGNPSLEDVAEQAGVSPRSVYRHFGSMAEARQELADETIRFVAGLVDSASGPVLDEATLDERCVSLVMARFNLHDRAGKLVVSASAHRAFNSFVSDSYEALRAEIEAQLPDRFAAELDGLTEQERTIRLAIVNTLMSDVCITDVLSRFEDRRNEIVPRLAAQVAAALTGAVASGD